jgi:olfactory receptor
MLGKENINTGKSNQSSMTEFVLVGLSGYPELFLSMYLVILPGNEAIATLSDSHLNTPEYFFLSNLSFLGICYTSSFLPQFLSSFSPSKQTISFCGYEVQMFLFFAT